jgi:putative SOS response-associated peptidase YedK
LGHARIIRAAPNDDTMLPFERKASPSSIGRAIVVNGRIGCFALSAIQPSSQAFRSGGVHRSFRARHDRTGNLPQFPGIFPDQMAPIVRNGADGERELVMARWGMPGPPQFGGAPITNIRNVGSPHWRGWLGKQNRCVVPATLKSY